jgi:protein-S-isoprenylcysteine O-methyltransferase Ste14
MQSLHLKGLVGISALFAVIALLLFGGAGTLRYWQAWTFLAAYFAASIAITLYLMRYDPALLARRMSGGPLAEKEPTQKIIMWIFSAGFVGLLVLPAIDHRLGWSQLSPVAALAGDALMLVGWLGIFFVFRENSFTASTIALAEDQKVITTGPYAWVRHPMYAASLAMLLGIPIALGSWWGVLIVLAMLPVLIWRLLDEERFLARNLPGYIDYQGRVRYRLLPFIW